jgi:hypothetical protein
MVQLGFDSCAESHWFCHGILFQTDWCHDILKIGANHGIPWSIRADECPDSLVNASVESNTI